MSYDLLSANQPLRIAIACHQPVVSGGFLRFVRFAREAQKKGHRTVFLQFSSEDCKFPLKKCSLELMPIDQAVCCEWDVTMIPGAGFPESTLNQFNLLTEARFGVRVQHVLNDQSRLDKFQLVNQCFRPHAVVFNNLGWDPGSFTSFSAHSFWHLLGAVSVHEPAKQRSRPSPTTSRTLVVGGLANKNPIPLLEAIKAYEAPIRLRLIGHNAGLEVVYKDLFHDGRVEFVGVVEIDELDEFYEQLDCVVHTELFAGWANLAAESLANQVPLICTPHGTQAFAINEFSALLLNEPSPEQIVRQLRRIHTNENDIVGKLVANGLQIISQYRWEAYTSKLLEIISICQHKFYTFAPSLGLHGKWPLPSRREGLTSLIEGCSGCSILDLGCAEGVISKLFLQAGASLAHCFERESDYIANASKILQGEEAGLVIQADVSVWDDFLVQFRNVLLPVYDIVLCLGLYHHLPSESRDSVLQGAAQLAGSFFVIRTTDAAFTGHHIHRQLLDLGFHLHDRYSSDPSINMGGLHIYRRSPGER